ncbi:MAG: hypothetical protein LBC30_04700, partial [Puniceicoccales bacterium]|nr:hypothetical protein [Puniceicoccales bacterium]
MISFEVEFQENALVPALFSFSLFFQRWDEKIRFLLRAEISNQLSHSNCLSFCFITYGLSPLLFFYSLFYVLPLFLFWIVQVFRWEKVIYIDHTVDFTNYLFVPSVDQDERGGRKAMHSTTNVRLVQGL